MVHSACKTKCWTTPLSLSSFRTRYSNGLLILLLSSVVCTILAQTTESADGNLGKCLSAHTIKAEVKEKLKGLVGKTFEATDNDNSFGYTVGICAEITDSASGTAVVQQELENGKPKTDRPHIIGSLKNVQILAGTDWIMIEYGEGENYGTHCGQESKRSLVMIACDESVDDNKAEMVFVQEENTRTEHCFYLFELKHKSVCPVPTGSSGLSVGSILCIVFFSVLGVYLLVGFLYQRFVLGSKGLEQIPNYEFWKDFGNLQADGCDFMCRTKGHNRLNYSSGLGDDQLDPAAEVRDDNLLPM